MRNGRTLTNTAIYTTASVILLILLASLSSLPASANDTVATEPRESTPPVEDPDYVDAPEEAYLSPDVEEGVGGFGIMSFSPASCTGTTHDPHRSTHVPGTVNVVGNTKCYKAVPQLGLHVKLYRSRWYGWEKVGDSSFRTKNNTSAFSVNAASGNCKGTTHDWQGRTYHESIEGGKKYTANTANTKRFTC